MKYLKIIGLAAIAAAALMAFAGSASATVLCKANESPCSSANTYPAGTRIHAELKEGEAVLTAGFGNIQCKISTIEGKTANAGSSTETVHGAIEKLTFENCNGGACTVTVLKTGELEIHTELSTSNGNGTLTAKGQEVTTNCTFFNVNYHCIWSTGTTGTDLGTLTGGAPATLTAKEALISRTGGTSGVACGSSGKWDAVYKVTTPSPLFVI
jgi:hypothetical protein